MYNQEQLAAIAAAMSILQQSMQSDPTQHTSAGGGPPQSVSQPLMPQNQPRIHAPTQQHHHQQLPPPTTTNQPPLPQPPQAQQHLSATNPSAMEQTNHRPISYSAIVAKSAGLNNNTNINNISNANTSNISGCGPGGSIGNNINNNNNLSSSSSSNNNNNNNHLVASSTIHPNHVNGNIPTINSIISHNKSTNLLACNNTFGGITHHNNIGSIDHSPVVSGPTHFSATNSVSKPDLITGKTNNVHSNGTLVHNHHQHLQQQQQHQHLQHLQSLQNHNLRSSPLNASNFLVTNSLNNNIASSTNNDIFNTNLTGSSLGQSNGSLLQQNSNILVLEPTLNYTTDHSTSPAQQLFNHRDQNSNRHHQIQNTIQQHHQIQNSLQHQQQQLHNSMQRHQTHQQNQHPGITNVINVNTNSTHKSVPPNDRATNLLGFMGLYVGNLSPDLTKEQLEKIFSKYGEPVKAHRLIRSPVAFIKYENTEAPRAAIDDLYGVLLPELTLNQDQPLKLHFDRNDAQLKANYRPTELPKDDNGECYGWRTTVCRRGKTCPKKHIPINRGIDFQMWMIKSTTPTTSAS